jgi:hypothetical protein
MAPATAKVMGKSVAAASRRGKDGSYDIMRRRVPLEVSILATITERERWR